MGNPPYRRVTRDEAGGWVTHAEGTRPALMQDIIDVANARTIFSHVASLYNLYVYFWRFALWKAFEQRPGAPGIVGFITASSWFDGPGLVGLREAARTLCSEMWIIDFGGDNRGTRPDGNVFAIETPVAITILIRGQPTDEATPAVIRFRTVEGTRAENSRRSHRRRFRRRTRKRGSTCRAPPGTCFDRPLVMRLGGDATADRPAVLAAARRNAQSHMASCTGRAHAGSTMACVPIRRKLGPARRTLPEPGKWPSHRQHGWRTSVSCISGQSGTTAPRSSVPVAGVRHAVDHRGPPARQDRKPGALAGAGRSSTLLRSARRAPDQVPLSRFLRPLRTSTSSMVVAARTSSPCIATRPQASRTVPPDYSEH